MGGRRLIRVAGTAVLVVGVFFLVWGLVTVQWGDPFTGLYTRWKQRQLTADLATVEQRYSLPPTTAKPSPAVDATRIRRAARTLRREAASGDPIGRIDVPELGLEMTLVNGTDTQSLRLGPGRDLHTYMPGEGELVYIAGHRTTYLAPFAHIDRLQPGDRVTLRMPYVVANYRVTGHVIVPATDVGRLRTRGREEVALQACHPRFSASQRYIVYAKLVSLRPVTKGA